MTAASEFERREELVCGAVSLAILGLSCVHLGPFEFLGERVENACGRCLARAFVP